MMTPLDQIAPAFVEMAHSIVWASVATVDADSRPRTRILHPIWEWDGTDLFGWIATVPTPGQAGASRRAPEVSVSYWAPSHDTCSAEALVEWYSDDETCTSVWDKFANGPEPVGYDPDDHPGVEGRADVRRVRRAAAEPVPAEGDARHGDDEGRRRGPALALVSEVSALPLAPKNPLSIRQLLTAVRNLDAGQEVLRDAGGPVTRIQFGPKWLFPPVVAVFSPSGIRDVLGRNDSSSERCIVHEEVRQLAGDSLFVLPNEPWLPRKRALQPVFTKPNVRNFGGHMSRAAQALCESWPDSGEVDLDVDCRRVTMRSLGRSVLGLDLNDREDVIARSHARRVVLHRRPRAAPGALTAMVADPARARAARFGGSDAQGDRRHAAGVPCRSDP